MKTLIILAHPDLEKSKVNKRWIEEAEKYLDKFTVHKLYEAYPNEIIDIKKRLETLENKLIQLDEKLEEILKKADNSKKPLNIFKR